MPYKRAVPYNSANTVFLCTLRCWIAVYTRLLVFAQNFWEFCKLAFCTFCTIKKKKIALRIQPVNQIIQICSKIWILLGVFFPSTRLLSPTRLFSRVRWFLQHMLIIEMEVDNCIINNVYQNHFCIGWPTEPIGGRAHCARTPLVSWQGLRAHLLRSGVRA